MSDRLPLSGITVIDCGQVIAGPTVAMILGDFGAEVIKVENPGSGDSMRAFGRHKEGVPIHWKWISRNKKSITLSLSKPAGQELFCRLVKTTQADVLIESFRPGTLERWNLTFERLQALSPKLTLVRVSGFGQNGPYRDRPGFGTLAEAMSGFANIVGPKDGPPSLPPFPLADSVAALYATIGTLMLLLQQARGTFEHGQVLDVSLLEPLFSIMGEHLLYYDQFGTVAVRRGNRVQSSAPRNTYRTSDDRWIAISGSTQSIAERVFKVIGRPELITDPRFKSNPDRLANVDELDEIVGGWVARHTQDEAMRLLIEAEVAAAPIADIAQLAVDPQLEARGTIAAVEDRDLGRLRMPNVLPSLSETPGEIRHTGPNLGEHNDEIYRGRLGLSETELAQLKANGII